jgi:hypothetical protein
LTKSKACKVDGKRNILATKFADLEGSKPLQLPPEQNCTSCKCIKMRDVAKLKI